MKNGKPSLRGILVLLVWAVVLTAAVLMYSGELRAGFSPPSGRASLALWLGVCATLVICSKKRLRLLLLMAAASVLGALMGRMDLTRGQAALAAAGLCALYLLGCAAANWLRYAKLIRALNAATAAYREDRDGEAFLAALDGLFPKFSEQQTVRRFDAGIVTFREHLLCEKIQVLGDMGRLEERQALIDRLRQETKSPGLPAWLDERAAEFGAAPRRGDSAE